MEVYALGIDIGTGSVKAVALTPSGEMIYTDQLHYPTIHTQPDFFEQDPEIVFDAFSQLITRTVVQLGSDPAVISLSSAMHSLMSVDEKGKPLSYLMLWSDSRSAAVAQRIRNSAEAELIYRQTGTPIHSMSPLCKITWLKENRPELFHQSFKFISIKEFIWFRLFGEFKIDHSIASATGLFDIDALQWNSSALRIAGITADQLSIPVPTSYVRSELQPPLAASLRISPSTIFCIGASDGCLANLGSNAMQTDIAGITIGTSGAVRTTRKEPLRDFSIMSFNYILDESHFVCGGPINNGGNVLQWLLKKFSNTDDLSEDAYEKFFNRVQQVHPGCEGLIFLPYLYSERSPIWDDNSCGVFFGLRSSHGHDHFLRAAVEGVCFALCDIVVALEKTSPIRQVNVSGGFVRSAVWMQILSDVLQKKICVQQKEDASATGAARMGMKAVHMVENYMIPHKAETYIYPQAQYAGLYKKNFMIYQSLYPSLKQIMHLHNHSNSV